MSYSLDAIYHSASWAIWNHSQKLFSLQEQAATGQKINRPSDDPTATNRILELKNDTRNADQYIGMIDSLTDTLNMTDTVVNSISKEMVDAMANFQKASGGGGGNESSRADVAKLMDNALEQIVMLINQDNVEFAGANGNVDPYRIERDSADKITGIVYQGSYEDRDVAVAPGVKMSAVLVGDNIFRHDNPTGSVFVTANDAGLTDTGVAAGAGTSSARGDVTLEIRAGGGPPDYQLSIDGGASWTDANLTDTDLPVTNSVTGEVLFVDASGITSAGTEMVRMPGTYDVFNVLINARDMMSNTTLNTEDWNHMYNDTVAEMRDVQQGLVRAFPVIGGRMQTLASLRSTLDNIKFNAETETSALADADIAQVAMEMSRHEVLYQMSLKVASTMFSQSLMDFIA